MSDPLLKDAIGTIDGVNDTFDTPVAYQSGTLWAFLNGQLIEAGDDDGPVEQGGTQVKMGKPPKTGDKLAFWFHTGPPTPGAFFTPPTALSALVLTPKGRVAKVLSPTPLSVETPTEATDLKPDPLAAIHLRPTPRSAKDLRPKPVSAEEI